ncbi:MAG TPA: DUF5302 domain-containing protein [Actinomycetaceae bacterium]|nr:DUF5302 domain-containing protein [Actinomycetaceae bacterium]
MVSGTGAGEQIRRQPIREEKAAKEQAAKEKAAREQAVEEQAVEEQPEVAPTPTGATDGEGDVDAVKAKMRDALEKKKAREQSGEAGQGKAKASHTAAAGQQRRVFRRKSG